MFSLINSQPAITEVPPQTPIMEDEMDMIDPEDPQPLSSNENKVMEAKRSNQNNPNPDTTVRVMATPTRKQMDLAETSTNPEGVGYGIGLWLLIVLGTHFLLSAMVNLYMPKLFPKAILGLVGTIMLVCYFSYFAKWRKSIAGLVAAVLTLVCGIICFMFMLYTKKWKNDNNKILIRNIELDLTWHLANKMMCGPAFMHLLFGIGCLIVHYV
jgi:hypothetical protein